ncbi:hypothetical protein ABZT49_05900 [Methylobacterium sp. EM32]|uniref:hypothetical protein n=1 Tax=unclassified Methylobacterium TaxID=2615210 RepID=UPI0008EBA6CF|nr:hypothetical protein [Methylobacterium sp. 174MFSha1.1]SFU92592.1 hypothetical protein SAMN02799631_03170 [Methylobacterium sp. 174MFSha1.1]
MTDITAKARGFIAGEIAASGTRPAADVAGRILARLDRQGLAVVDASQAQAVSALAGIDAILALRDLVGDEELVQEWATQLGMESPAGLMAALVAVRDVLDRPQAPTFTEAALRDAYRLGFDRGAYDAGGHPLAYDHEGDEFRLREAADLQEYLGEAPVDEALARLNAAHSGQASVAA